MKTDLDKHIERHLKDKEFRIYFDRAEAKRKIAQEIADLRKTHHITQAQLAKEIKTSQQAISRLESPHDKRMPSLEFLDRIARVFNRRLVISLQR
ncbi:MAG: helix-turn-helix transcriptional regulator [Nitrospirota bacterium]|jgi:DNA-binding XRE family transcriptional regulator